MTFTEISPSEVILTDLIHDLRQPLGNIETSAYCLNLITDPAQVRTLVHLRVIQQQVARAEELLAAAIVEMRRQRD